MLVHFKKGENKEEFVRPLIDAAAAEGGEGKVVLIGVAQEKAPVWRSWKAKGHEYRAHPHMEWGRQMAFVNHARAEPEDKAELYTELGVELTYYPDRRVALNALTRGVKVRVGGGT